MMMTKYGSKKENPRLRAGRGLVWKTMDQEVTLVVSVTIIVWR